VVVLQMVYYIVNVVNKGELHDKNSFFYVWVIYLQTILPLTLSKLCLTPFGKSPPISSGPILVIMFWQNTYNIVEKDIACTKAQYASSFSHATDLPSSFGNPTVQSFVQLTIINVFIWQLSYLWLKKMNGWMDAFLCGACFPWGRDPVWRYNGYIVVVRIDKWSDLLTKELMK
jgi:hypothetical protein